MKLLETCGTHCGMHFRIARVAEAVREELMQGKLLKAGKTLGTELAGVHSCLNVLWQIVAGSV